MAATLAVLVAACSSDDEPASDAADPTTDPTGDPATESTTASGDPGEDPAGLRAGSATRSILPTVDGSRDFLDQAPGWPTADEVDPDDPGVFVAEWDQGRVDVGNGSEDSAWVHDDLSVVAVALDRGGERTVIVSSDTYMHFAADADEIVRRAHEALPDDWAEVPILVAATHNHHGPDTAFSINDDWYSEMADQAADAVVGAVEALQPATASVASGSHGYGVADVRDPIVMDRRLNVLTLDGADSSEAIATIVQWNSHPETTLGWEPPADAAGLDEACATKGWEPDDCTAEGRYLTADYPGVLRDRLAETRGGDVLYVNGPLGSQIGPGQAPTWVVDADHPVTDDGTAPEGAEPLTTCDEGDPLLCRSLAKTESIGTQLAAAVTDLVAEAEPLDVAGVTVETEPFFTRLTHIGFRVLLADGTLGWQDPELFTCDGHPAEDTCEPAAEDTEEDPVITPLADSEVVIGDVIQTRIVRLDLGDVGFMFMPGELPPELVVGLPDDFASAPEQYFREAGLHDVSDYEIPGHLLDLVDEDITFTVGLGTDELGYYVPVGDYRLTCTDLALPDGATCADLAARDVIPAPEYIDGTTCDEITEDPAALEPLGDDGPAVAAICRYGQALGREIGEPDGHYEETVAAGWDMVEDLWAGARRLYG